MTRRSLFKTLLGCVAAPVAVPQPPTMMVRYKTENNEVYVKVGSEDWKPLVRDLRI